MLEVKDLRVSYGVLEALHGITLGVEKGHIVSIIGSNGAGKSTLLRTLSGMRKIIGGFITFENAPLPKRPHKIVGAGIVHVPEGRKIFIGLTVRDNLRVGAYLLKDKKAIDAMIDEQFELFPILRERQTQLGGTLSGGEQQMLAIARGMMGKPKLLLLDEPSLGLAPKIVTQVFQIIDDIRSKGVTVLLVEQNAKKSLQISDYAYVLENGRLVMSGAGQELLHDPKINDAYLGKR